MAKKGKTKKTDAVRKKSPGRTAGRAVKPTGMSPKAKLAARKTRELNTWRRMARLADDVLAALDAGEVKEARSLLQGIRGVAASADADRA